MIRDVARELSQVKNVMIVDTSNEIGTIKNSLVCASSFVHCLLLFVIACSRLISFLLCFGCFRW